MRIGKFLYRYRSLSPLPLVIFLLIFAVPSVMTILLGIIVSIIGEFIRFISVSYTGSTTRSKNIQCNSLVTNGPYGYLRNPIYFGNFFLSLGIVISANTFFPWFVFLFIVLFSVQYFFIIRFEEEFLRERFGKSYERYVNNVPSFFPRFSPYLEGNNSKPALKKTFRSEKTTFTIVTLLYIIIVFIYFLKRL